MIRKRGDRMASEANVRAAIKYNRETVDQIMIKPHKEEGKRIRQAAKAAGQPVQRYVLDAVRERMERETTVSEKK